MLESCKMFSTKEKQFHPFSRLWYTLSFNWWPYVACHGMALVSHLMFLCQSQNDVVSVFLYTCICNIHLAFLIVTRLLFYFFTNYHNHRNPLWQHWRHQTSNLRIASCMGSNQVRGKLLFPWAKNFTPIAQYCWLQEWIHECINKHINFTLKLK